MRIGLNATCLNDRPSGAKQRFLGIYGSLFKLLPDVEFAIFEPSDCNMSSWFSSQSNVECLQTPLSSTSRISKIILGLNYWKKIFDNRYFDIFEEMHLPLVRHIAGKSLLTLHDVRYLNKNNGPFKRMLYANFLRDALDRADHVITVSNSMRKEILRFSPNTYVSVVYNGIDPHEATNVTKRQVTEYLTKYRLPKEYVLAVGHFEARKNYPRLIKAISLLKKRGLDVPLVIVGNDSGELSSLQQQIVDLNVEKQVTLLLGLSDDEVKCAYQSCSLLAFPSRYEGFGIPILEAMAAEKPMVLSDLPIFSEITQGKSIYFDHDNVEAIADAVELGLCSLKVREDMVKFGSSRLNDFNFKRLSQQVAQIYCKLL